MHTFVVKKFASKTITIATTSNFVFNFELYVL